MTIYSGRLRTRRQGRYLWTGDPELSETTPRGMPEPPVSAGMGGQSYSVTEEMAGGVQRMGLEVCEE